MLVNDLLDAFMDDGTSILELVPVQNEVGNTHYVYTPVSYTHLTLPTTPYV